MVGSALARLNSSPWTGARSISARRPRFDWFGKTRVIFLAAAKVGGIVANNTLRAFIYDNIAIAAHLIQAAHRNGAEKLMFLGPPCIYPKDAAQPLREDSVLTGPLEPTNEAYAIAKIAGIKTVGLSQPVRMRLHQRDADQPLRPRRQLSSRNESRGRRPDPSLP